MTTKPKKAAKKGTKRVAKKAPAKSRARTPPFKHLPEWSTAKFWSFLRSGLRAKFSRWPPKYTVLKNARRQYKGPNKKQLWEFQCAMCKEWHLNKDTSVDHVTPCGSLKCYDDLPGFVERMFVGVDGLRLLCNTCHKAHTKEQRGNKCES